MQTYQHDKWEIKIGQVSNKLEIIIFNIKSYHMFKQTISEEQIKPDYTIIQLNHLISNCLLNLQDYSLEIDELEDCVVIKFVFNNGVISKQIQFKINQMEKTNEEFEFVIDVIKKKMESYENRISQLGETLDKITGKSYMYVAYDPENKFTVKPIGPVEKTSKANLKLQAGLSPKNIIDKKYTHNVQYKNTNTIDEIKANKKIKNQEFKNCYQLIDIGCKEITLNGSKQQIIYNGIILNNKPNLVSRNNSLINVIPEIKKINIVYPIYVGTSKTHEKIYLDQFYELLYLNEQVDIEMKLFEDCQSYQIIIFNEQIANFKNIKSIVLTNVKRLSETVYGFANYCRLKQIEFICKN